MSLTDTAVVNAATALNDDLTSNGCQTSAQSSVSDFQSAYNAAGGSPALTVDGLYGANTQAALQAVMLANSGTTLGSYSAPAGCVGSGGGGSSGGGGGAIVTTSSPNMKWWLIGGGAVLLAGGIYAYSRHHKKGRRR